MQGERRTTEERYRTLVEAMSNGLLEVDENLGITFVNAQFARMLGYQEAELLGRRSLEFIDEAERRLIPERIGEQYELTWTRRDGKPVPTLVSARPIFDGEGRYQGSVSVITDLTELKRAAVARDALARLVDNAQDAIFGESTDGVITTWNRGAERLYGYTAAEVVGQSIQIVSPPEHRAETAALIARVKSGEEVAHFETERVTKAGNRIWVALSLSPVTPA
jgi:PAS domain S-box-containing protein